MIDQYLKKKEKPEILEIQISSDDEPTQPKNTLSNNVELPLCKEEDYWIIVKNARLKTATQPLVAKKQNQKNKLAIANSQQRTTIVQQVCYTESQNEYSYNYDISIFDEERESVINEMSIRPNQTKQKEKKNSCAFKVNKGGEIQEQRPVKNMRRLILQGWMAGILASKIK